MQWVDWAILIVIAISAGVSLMRGFVREALSLAGWVIAFFVAKGFYEDVAPLLAGHIDTPSLRFGVAWGGLFLITLTLSGLVNYILGQLVENAGLSGMDRIMGMVFGALRGVLLVAVAIMLLKTFTPVERDPWWQQSQLIPHIETIGDWFYSHFKTAVPSASMNLADNDSLILN